MSIWLCMFLNSTIWTEGVKKEESHGQKKQWAIPDSGPFDKSLKNLRKKSIEPMISNGTKLIKGKYERPAVAVAGEQKSCAKETFAKKSGYFPNFQMKLLKQRDFLDC